MLHWELKFKNSYSTKPWCNVKLLQLFESPQNVAAQTITLRITSGTAQPDTLF